MKQLEITSNSALPASGNSAVRFNVRQCGTKRPKRPHSHLKSSCGTSPNFVSQEASVTSCEKTRFVKKSNSDAIAFVRDLAKSQHNSPLSINVLAKVFESNGHEVV
jgi:hypothetical protein